MSQMKKAERSRVHAKQRRTQEAKEISEIAEQLPLSLDVTRRLDKGAILRLALTYLRLKHLVGDDVAGGDGFDSAVSEGNLMLDSLNGFFIIVSTKGDIIFVSSNVETHTGLSEVDLLGKDINEFILEKDQKELKRQFAPKYTSGASVHGMALSASGNHIESDVEFTLPDGQEHHRQFFLRMKCSYQRRTGVARSQPLGAMQQSDYLLLQWTGSVHYDQEGNVSFLAAVVRPLQPTPIMELKMDGNMFISRHSLDLYFMYCDPRLATMLGYEPNEIPGSSMYQYHHPSDLEMCGKCHSNLMTAGTSISKYYRFLSKNDEWCWLQTRATIVYNTSKQPQYIVCMNYIVSEREGRRYLMEYFNKPENTLGRMPSNLNTALVGSLVNPLSDICLESDNVAEQQTFDAMAESVSANVPQAKPPLPSAAYQPTVTGQMPQHVGNNAPMSVGQSLGLDNQGVQHMRTPFTSNQQYSNVQQQGSLHQAQRQRAPVPIQQRYPVSNVSPVQQHPHGTTQQFAGNSPTHIPQASHSPAGVPQQYAGNSPTHVQQASHSPAGVPQQYAGNSPTHVQQASHSPGGVPQQYAGNSAMNLPQASHNPAGVPQHYPGNSPTHLQQASHSPGGAPQQYAANSPIQLQQHEQQLPLTERNVLPTTYAATESGAVPTTRGQASPVFYLPHQAEPEQPAVTQSAPPTVGEAWISVHLVADPTIHTQPEMMSGSLASEMEDISFDHCRQLMNQSTQDVLDVYTDQHLETSDRDEQDWSKCATIADNQARAMATHLMTDNAVRSNLPGHLAGELSAPHSMESSRSSSSTGSSNMTERHTLGKPDSGGFILEDQPQTLSAGYIKPEGDQFIAPEACQQGGGATVQMIPPPVYNDVMFPPPDDRQQVSTGAPTLSIPSMPATTLVRSGPSSMSLSSEPSFTSPDDLFRQSTQSLMSLSSDMSISSLLPNSSDADFTQFPSTTGSYTMPYSDSKQF